MNRLTTSSIVEDRYIAHLAGQQYSQKVINNRDWNNAYDAQKHPISNTIVAGYSGIVGAIRCATIGILASPLCTASMLPSFLGSRWEVASAAYTKAPALYDKLNNLSKFFDGMVGDKYSCTTIYRNHLSGRYCPQNRFGHCTKVATTFFQDKLKSFWVEQTPLDIYLNSMFNNQDLMKSRLINYVSCVADSVSDNALLIGAATTTLAGLIALALKDSYQENEVKAEKALIKTLENRFEKIAERLIFSAQNPEVIAASQRILDRQTNIRCELLNLNLPNLSAKKITRITAPVFQAAREITLQDHYKKQQ